MSDQITNAFVEQYSANVEHLAQQMECRFEGKVRTVSQKGKTQFFEQLGSTTAVKRTTRHADTPRVNSNHQRRQVTLSDYDWSDLVDTLDDVKLLINPASAYAQSAAMAFNRSKDQEIIDNATATAYADTGGGSIAAVSFPSAQQIAVGYVASGSTAVSGLTLAKLVQAKSILGKSELPRGEQLYFVHSQQQLDDLLVNVTEVKSSDYAAVKALVQGEVNYFMGFEFIKTELLATASSVRTCFAYAKNSLLLAVGQGARGRIAERPDKNHATQVYYNMSIGATRMQEVGVVSVACSEA